MRTQSPLEVDLFVSSQDITAWSTSVPAVLCHRERSTRIPTCQFASLKNASSFWMAPTLLASIFYNYFRFQTFTDKLAIRKAVTFQRKCSLTVRVSHLICFKTQGEKEREKRWGWRKMAALSSYLLVNCISPWLWNMGDPLFWIISLSLTEVRAAQHCAVVGKCCLLQTVQVRFKKRTAVGRNGKIRGSWKEGSLHLSCTFRNWKGNCRSTECW